MYEHENNIIEEINYLLNNNRRIHKMREREREISSFISVLKNLKAVIGANLKTRRGLFGLKKLGVNPFSLASLESAQYLIKIYSGAEKKNRRKS